MKAVLIVLLVPVAAVAAPPGGHGLPQAALRPLPEKVVAEIVVHPEVVTRPVSPVFLGTNLTQYEPDKTQIGVAVTLRRVRDMGVKTVRFPNGCFADKYNWQKPPEKEIPVEQFIEFCHAIAAALSGPAAAALLVDFEQPYFVEELGVQCKDHALVKVDGVYHVFYIHSFPPQGGDYLRSELPGFKFKFEQAFNKLMTLLKDSLTQEERESPIILQGASRLIGKFDAVDLDKLRSLFQNFEEKANLAKLLSDFISLDRVKVLIGSEANLPLISDCALVLSHYGDERQVFGSVGIIGPKRLPYKKIIPLVDGVAKKLSRTIRQNQS